jgi:hypothetical protein
MCRGVRFLSEGLRGKLRGVRSDEVRDDGDDYWTIIITIGGRLYGRAMKQSFYLLSPDPAGVRVALRVAGRKAVCVASLA